MTDQRYEKIQALIVDDVDNFRVMLFNMLQVLGVPKIDVAASDNEVTRLCAINTYDIILCDQNLGRGKSGQQILEQLRHTPNLNSDSMFVLVSGESNKNNIMAAFDYEPDDYLTKPIAAQTLELRLTRLLSQRLALAPIYQALKESNIGMAIELCRRELDGGNRIHNQCQKLLGRLLLEAERFNDAEKLYRDVLDIRQLDWAMLGMANVKYLQGDSLSAQQWLEELIQFNPLCLKAYDLLSLILQERGDTQAQQELLQQALELSPLSILRQQALGDVAVINNDIVSAAQAFRKSIKLGEYSCHDNVGVHIKFAKAAIQYAKADKVAAKPILRDAIKSASELPTRFGRDIENRVNACLLEAQLQLSAGEEKKCKELMLAAQKLIEKHGSELSLETKMEWVNGLRAQGKSEEAEQVIVSLLKDYSGSDDALQKIDSLLSEPSSEKNKNIVAKINKEGIAFYELKNFSAAIDSFSSALNDFPQHVGLRLNLLQSLIEQLKVDSQHKKSLLLLPQTLQHASQLIPSSHAQYRRFLQLEKTIKLMGIIPAASSVK